MLLAHDGERENEKEKLSSNILLVVFRGEEKMLWMVREQSVVIRRYINMDLNVDVE